MYGDVIGVRQQAYLLDVLAPKDDELEVCVVQLPKGVESLWRADRLHLTVEAAPVQRPGQGPQLFLLQQRLAPGDHQVGAVERQYSPFRLFFR